MRYDVGVYILEPLATQNDKSWDAMVQQRSDSTAFQSLAWRDALSETFKQFVPMYLLIKEQDTVIGGVPAFVFQPIRSIRLWHSMPWNLIGGPQIIHSEQVNPDKLMSEIETYLESASIENGWCERRWTLSAQASVKYAHILDAHGYERLEHFTHLLATSPDVDALWKAYNKRVRGAVRKAAKSGVKVIDMDSDAALTTFYNIYLATVKRLGGTPKPLAFMKALLRRNIAKLAVATYREKMIAGLLYLYFNRTVTLWCEASLPEFLQYRPNNAIFHHIITWACNTGYDWVDFGASPPQNSGLIAHKEQYGAKQTHLCHYTKVVSPIKRRVWTRSEGMLRKIYTWMRRKK